MLPSTAVRSTQRAIAASSPLAASTAAALPARSLPLVVRQRRHSSSKHSSTPKQTAAPPASAPKQSSGSTSGKKKSAKSKVAKDSSEGKQAHQDNGVQPPSVPSTAHIDPKVVYLASLFAQHRPLGLNQPVPPQDNHKSFDAIFAPRSSKSKPQDVIFTLASAVKQLESAASGPQSLDGNTAQQSLNIEDLTRTFRPFNAPPAPVPMDAAYAEKRVSTPAVSFGMEEPPMPEGVAAEIIDKPDNSRSIQAPFRERMRARHETWLSRWIRQFREQWSLISVKRQRRVKMKKHKYKKLMRRTRNLRRRQDRL